MAVEDFGKDLKKVAEMNRDYPTIILDNGHGGVINGVYQTSGKRSPIWADGRQLFEGEFNRAIVKRVIKIMESKGYPYLNLVDTEKDIDLTERTHKANKFLADGNDCILISCHANAGGGSGHEVFTFKPKSKDPKKDEIAWNKIKDTKLIKDSEAYAKIFVTQLEKEFPELKSRGHKRANFAMTRQSKMPSLLIEFAFMDTLSPDCELLFSEQGRDRFAKATIASIEEIYLIFSK